MGGYSSGRKSVRKCTTDCLSFDVRQWQREGILVAGSSFNSNWSRQGKSVGNIGAKVESNQLTLSYTSQKNGGEVEKQNYPVRLQTTHCHYGGERYWFICPAEGCGRRVAILYLGDKIFACRHCYQLAYKSQRETRHDRAFSRADKMRGKLGWEPGIANPNGYKPKGMHWKTFYRLSLEHDADANRAIQGIMTKFK